MYNNSRKKTFNIFLAIFTFVIMALFVMADGVVWGVDTQGYLNMDISREAGYPLFLKLFVCIFGEDGFAQAVVIFQYALLGTSILLLTYSVTKIWSLSAVSEAIVWLIQISFLLLLKFGAKRGAVYAGILLTEGITYSIYLLFFKAVLQLKWEYSCKKLLELLLYCSILTFIRTQLAVTFAAVVCLWFIQVIAGRFPIRKWINMTAGCIVGLILVMCGQKIYTYALYGVASGTVGRSSFYITSGLYNACMEDETLFETEEERQAFRDLYNLSIQREANCRFAESGEFLALSEHYSYNFDVIKFEIVSPYFYERAASKGLNEAQIQIEMDSWNKRIGFPLLVHHIKDKMAIFLQECVKGYMRTIAKSGFIFIFPVAAVYFIYLFCMFRCFGLKEIKAETAGWVALFVLIVTTGNIILTAFMIFCEPRYVLYNMIPFYITGYLLILEIYRKRKETRTL